MAFSTETQIIIHDINKYFRDRKNQFMQGWKDFKWGFKHNVNACWEAFCEIPYNVGRVFILTFMRIGKSIERFVTASVDGMHNGLVILWRYTKILFLGRPPFDIVLYDTKNGLIMIPPQPDNGRVIMVELGKHGCYELKSPHYIDDWACTIPSRLKDGKRKKIILEFSTKNSEWCTQPFNDETRHSKYFTPERVGEEECYFDRLGV